MPRPGLRATGSSPDSWGALAEARDCASEMPGFSSGSSDDGDLEAAAAPLDERRQRDVRAERRTAMSRHRVAGVTRSFFWGDLAV